MSWNPMTTPNFTPDELRCKCGCNSVEMDQAFMTRLQGVRDMVGFPLTVTSGYRCQSHNDDIGGGPAHPSGRAVDIAVAGERAFSVLKAAIEIGMTGIGVAQKGSAGRFIHLDTYNGPDAPRPRVWSY